MITNLIDRLVNLWRYRAGRAQRRRRARTPQIDDLAQALEMEIRHAIEGTYDRVDRDDALPRKSLEQEIELACPRSILRLESGS